MTTAENIFIVVASFGLVLFAVLNKNIDWEKVGFKPRSLIQGWRQVVLFNAAIFTAVQLAVVNNIIVLPDWMLDKDPFVPLLIIVFLQEILFRGVAISWLERFGEQRALWVSVGIFVLFHLIAPYTWSSIGIIFAGITFIGGYFWGWHFLKFRNIYLLTTSHFLVNLSFNYLFL
jgi:membrane protease YdiL (CAAX protease family)